MNLKQTSILASLIAGGAFALSAAPARAASFGFSAQDAVDGGCVGQTSCLLDGFFSLSATQDGNAAEFFGKNVGNNGHGVLGLGIASDADQQKEDQSWGEIDANEVFEVDFDKSAVLNELQLSHMYQPGEMMDWVYEKAAVEITLDDDSVKTGYLQVTGDKSAAWSWSDGTVSNVSASWDGVAEDRGGPNNDNYDQGVIDHPSDDKDGIAEDYVGGGSYVVSNPFGDLLVKNLKIKAERVARPDNGKTPLSDRNSDLTVSSVVATTPADIPEPATTAALIGFGAMALGLRRRKQ